MRLSRVPSPFVECIMENERRRRYGVFAGLALVACGLGGWAMFHKPADKAKKVHPVPVTAVAAVRRDLPLTVSALGAAQAWTSDTIFARVSGMLTKVNFTEGSQVHAGQVLAEVDPAPFRAALMVETGTLHRDQAILAGAERDLQRYKTLLATNAVPRQTEEDEEATVAQDRATVEMDRGNVQTAQINLSWTRIVSPVTGRAGVRLVDPGNLVSSSGSTASAQSTAAATSSASSSSSSGSGIVVINQLQPIAVTFTIPEGQFSQLAQMTDSFRKPLPVQAFGQESQQLLDSGQLTITDNKVDQATGSVELKAKFANSAMHLWPGQFVNVKLATQTLHDATVIPDAAVNRGPNGSYAFVVGADNKVQMRPLTVLGSDDGFTAVKAGVKPGDKVVVDGQMMLKAGSQVKITGSQVPETGA
ncbi:efflux RND transporter periplasmic adaptor subunit [Novosphingobium sp. 9]|uniref:efflux RND transporter periplasmic adaptor subunit n=1 Tax=Novosphingobium sp. 9 TaxID=2025349 RepID=UPI0021B66910|nr:efflux RND transporter periplasmic adaptor subunit [Novosphingobium sp. 9]